jgi:hypothetical protein
LVLLIAGPRLLKLSWAPALDEHGDAAERREDAGSVPPAAKPQAGAT